MRDMGTEANGQNGRVRIGWEEGGGGGRRGLVLDPAYLTKMFLSSHSLA